MQECAKLARLRLSGGRQAESAQNQPYPGSLTPPPSLPRKPLPHHPPKLPRRQNFHDPAAKLPRPSPALCIATGEFPHEQRPLGIAKPLADQIEMMQQKLAF